MARADELLSGAPVGLMDVDIPSGQAASDESAFQTQRASLEKIEALRARHTKLLQHPKQDVRDDSRAKLNAINRKYSYNPIEGVEPAAARREAETVEAAESADPVFRTRGGQDIPASEVAPADYMLGNIPTPTEDFMPRIETEGMPAEFEPGMDPPVAKEPATGGARARQLGRAALKFGTAGASELIPPALSEGADVARLTGFPTVSKSLQPYADMFSPEQAAEDAAEAPLSDEEKYLAMVPGAAIAGVPKAIGHAAVKGVGMLGGVGRLAQKGLGALWPGAGRVANLPPVKQAVAGSLVGGGSAVAEEGLQGLSDVATGEGELGDIPGRMSAAVNPVTVGTGAAGGFLGGVADMARQAHPDLARLDALGIKAGPTTSGVGPALETPQAKAAIGPGGRVTEMGKGESTRLSAEGIIKELQTLTPQSIAARKAFGLPSKGRLKEQHVTALGKKLSTGMGTEEAGLSMTPSRRQAMKDFPSIEAGLQLPEALRGKQGMQFSLPSGGLKSGLGQQAGVIAGRLAEPLARGLGKVAPGAAQAQAHMSYVEKAAALAKEEETKRLAKLVAKEQRQRGGR